MAFVPLAKLHQLYDGLCLPMVVAGKNLLLVQEEGKTWLIANQCPHLGASLSRASLQGGWLRCPAHGMEFNLASGEARNRATCPGKLRHFPLAYEGNSVGVYLDDN